MKRLVFILCILFPLTVMGQSDPQAKNYLDKVVATLQKNPIQTDFSALYLNSATSEKETKTGSLRLKGSKFYFSFSDMEIYFDGKTQWNYLRGANEVTISEPTGKELQEVNPLLMISDFRKNHKVNFDAEDENDKECRLLNLYPNDIKAQHFRVLVRVNRSTMQVVKIAIYFKNGTSTTFTTKNYRVVKELTDADFTFSAEKYPKVIINDLR